MINGKFHIEVDKVTAKEWDGHHYIFQDSNLYQTWAYGAVRWGIKNLSHLVLRKENDVVAIAQLRIIRHELLPGGIAYMRWGPLVHRHGTKLEQESLNQMANALNEEYVLKRRLCLRILPDAFIGFKRAEMLESGFSRSFKSHSGLLPNERTFLLDLSPPLNELRKRLDQKWRNQLNRAEKNGLTIHAGTGIADFELFTGLYRAMWNRKRFETTVNIDEFAEICEILPEKSKLKILICFDGEEPVSGIVCSAMGDKGIYILGATTDSGLKSKGAYLLQWSIISWLKENGFKYYDLGGIDPEHNPGVYHFKSGLSGQDVTRLPPLQSCKHPFSALYMYLADNIARKPGWFSKKGFQRAKDSLSPGKSLINPS